MTKAYRVCEAEEHRQRESFTDGYFQMMSDIGHGYEAARVARKAEKEALMKADDWDGVKAWNEREKSFPFPFSDGYMKAYRAWQESTENQSSIFEVQDLPWAKDAHDFIACLKEARITEFAITDRSTALMELLHVLADEEGCKMVGLCKVTRTENRWSEYTTEKINGLKIEL